MNAIWMVRSRQLASRLKFWSALVGYNPSDRSIGQGVYLAYVVVFFALWGFSVLALLADLGSSILSSFRGMTPDVVARLALAGVLILEAILRSYRAARQSPFIFSEEDAVLICQTPLDRRYIAIAWMISDWLTAALPGVVLAIVLSFANIQLTEAGGVQWSHLPYYWLAGVRIASIVLPIHLGLTALGYGLGALRLRGSQDYPFLSWIPIGVLAVLLLIAFVNPAILQGGLWPLLYPLKAGLGEGSWVVGIGLGFLMAFIGVLVLYFTSSELSLSQAAQESHFRWIYKQVGLLGDSSAAQRMIKRQRLGSGHAPSRLPARAGAWSLHWKDWVIRQRLIGIRQLGAWLGLFITSLSMILPWGAGAHLWAFVIWVLMVGQLGIRQLRADLELWAITRQLPFRSGELILHEVIQPALGVTVVSWLAFGVCSWLGYAPQPAIVLLIPPAGLCVILAAAFDVLRQCRGSELCAGNVSDLGAGGLLLGLVLAGIPLGLALLSSGQFGLGWVTWLIGLAAFGFTSAIAYGLWLLAAQRYQRIK